MEALMGYCNSCKTLRPIAVGLKHDSWVLVSHAYHGEPCPNKGRNYAGWERERNWTEESRWDLE